MALKIAFLNSKGGVGKTTACINTAGYAHRTTKKKVLIADVDPQGTTRDWRQVQEDSDLPTVVGLDRPNMVKDLLDIEHGFDIIFMDAGSKTKEIDSKIIKIADIIVIPVQPSIADIWGASDLIELIAARQQVTNGIPKAGFLITRCKKNTKLASEIQPALEKLDIPEGSNIPLFKTRISELEQYKQALGIGMLAYDFGRSSVCQTIKKEIASFFKECVRFVG